MPTIRRRTPARRARVQVDHWIEFEFEFGPLFRDREALEEAWEVAGDEFLAKYIQEHPGVRPWAWWEFEAKHPRREVQTPLVRGEGLANGKRGGEVFVGNGDGELVPWLETEAEYLTRHKLWTRGERARFEALEVKP